MNLLLHTASLDFLISITEITNFNHNQMSAHPGGLVLDKQAWKAQEIQYAQM